MLAEISKDPAMMVWLDTNQNKKGTANENYARELMELFTLGIGHYTEQDVREGARAFTGWEIKDGKFSLNSGQHDGGPKKFLGREGKFGGEDIMRICLEQDAAAEFIVGKLFRFLVSETIVPTRELIAPLAARFHQSDYDLHGLVETILRSNLFFSPEAYRTRDQIARRFRRGHRPGFGRSGRRDSFSRRPRGAWAAASLAVVGEGLAGRNGLDQFEHAPAAAQSGARDHVNAGRPVRPPHRSGRAGAQTWQANRRRNRRFLRSAVSTRQHFRRRPRQPARAISAAPASKHTQPIGANKTAKTTGSARSVTYC